MPKVNELPPLELVTPLSVPTMGVAVEGSELSWSSTVTTLSLPTFEVLEDNNYYIDVYNKGVGNFIFTATTNKPWIEVSQSKGNVEKETRLTVSIDWNQLVLGNHQGEVSISDGNSRVAVKVNAKKYPIPSIESHYFGGA